MQVKMIDKNSKEFERLVNIRMGYMSPKLVEHLKQCGTYDEHVEHRKNMYYKNPNKLKKVIHGDIKIWER